MIPVAKNFNNIPASLSSAACVASLTEVLNTADPDHKEKIKQKFYGSQDVVQRLKATYHNKCAYCESYEPQPEVEHFRPKKRVNGVQGHPGYYWLCYEWSNLMPACHDCNKNGVKGNFFPVSGVRVIAPTFDGHGNLNLVECRLLSNTLYVNESPLLLNPEVPGFDPYLYFSFDRTGWIREVPIAGTVDYQRSNETIRIVDLNRDKLYLNTRKKNIRYYMGRIKGYIFRFMIGRKSQLEFEDSIFEILTEIKDNSAVTKEYSFFWDFLYKNFNIFITYYFKPKYRPRLFEIVNRFKAANP